MRYTCFQGGNAMWKDTNKSLRPGVSPGWASLLSLLSLLPAFLPVLTISSITDVLLWAQSMPVSSATWIFCTDSFSVTYPFHRKQPMIPDCLLLIWDCSDCPPGCLFSNTVAHQATSAYLTHLNPLLLPLLEPSLTEIFAASFLCLLNVYNPSSYRASKLFPLQKLLEHRAICCSDQNNGIFIHKLSEVEMSNVNPYFVTRPIHSGSISSNLQIFIHLW